jgi:hypothetical protein
MHYQIEDGVLARSVGDTVVLFHPETERLLTLHATGTRIWELLTEETDAERIIARLVNEFEGPTSLVEQQVVDFLVQLAKEQVVRQVE